jgi:hypothetical protein
MELAPRRVEIVLMNVLGCLHLSDPQETQREDRDDAYRGIFFGGFEGIGHRGVHGGGDGVFLLRPIQLDLLDAIAAGADDLLFSFRCLAGLHVQAVPCGNATIPKSGILGGALLVSEGHISESVALAKTIRPLKIVECAPSVESTEVRAIRAGTCQLRQVLAEKIGAPRVGDAAIFRLEWRVEIAAAAFGDQAAVAMPQRNPLGKRAALTSDAGTSLGICAVDGELAPASELAWATSRASSALPAVATDLWLNCRRFIPMDFPDAHTLARRAEVAGTVFGERQPFTGCMVAFKRCAARGNFTRKVVPDSEVSSTATQPP